MNKSIIVTNSFKGYHQYKDAPENVAFLKEVHRHIFNVRTTIEVFNNDRDIEFFQLQQHIETFVNVHYIAVNSQYLAGIHIESCEALAEAVLTHLHSTFPGRRVRVEVWEDNENGAIVEDEYGNF